MTQKKRNDRSFGNLLSELMTGEAVELPPGDLPRSELIELMSQVGRILPISEETWWEFLEILPPRWMNGYAFVFAEGGDRFRLFWKQGDRHFVRQLSEDETEHFCQLSGVSRWQ